MCRACLPKKQRDQECLRRCVDGHLSFLTGLQKCTSTFFRVVICHLGYTVEDEEEEEAGEMIGKKEGEKGRDGSREREEEEERGQA